VLAIALDASAAGAAPFAYVSNSNAGSDSVSVIDGKTNTVIATVPMPTGSFPYGVAVNPLGTRAYVANLFADSVSVIETKSNSVVTPPITVGFSMPSGVAVNALGTYVYVVNTGDSTISKIDTTSNVVVARIPTGAFSLSGFIAIHPVSGRVYVDGSINDNGDIKSGLFEIISDTGPQNFVPVGTANSFLQGIGVPPLQSTMPFIYLADTNGQVWVIDVTKIGTQDPVPVSSGSVGVPVGIAVSENFVYVTDQADNTVAIFDASPPNRLIGHLAVGRDPFGAALDPRGELLFVGNSDGDNSVSVIDTRTIVCPPAGQVGLCSTVKTDVVVGSSPLAFGAFVTDGPQENPTPAPTTCEGKIAGLEKQVSKLGQRHGPAWLKAALHACTAAMKELDKAKNKVPANDRRLQRAMNEFKNGNAALVAGHYRHATHEFWESFKLSRSILRHHYDWRR
jgi:YVTN family beta-propeller protein